MPEPIRYCDLARLSHELGRPVVLGHRGLPGDQVENRIGAFLQALALGADGIECDLQLSADGVPVVAHDRHLLRITGQQGTIGTSTVDKLRHLGLPSLEDVLEQLPTWAILNLEIKETRLTDSGLESAVVGAIERRNAQARVVFSSFSPFALARLHHLGNRYHNGLLTVPGTRYAWWAARLGRATAIHPHAAQVNQDSLAAWRRGDYRIVVWGDRDEHELARLKQMDIDAIITDHVGCSGRQPLSTPSR